EENRVAIETVSHIRSASLSALSGDHHPFINTLVK
ncbi:MAG: oxidoreductase, partial [Proteobacteria bacterium]